ncbi:hypothetical protein IP70_07865 [alpha proteobacterium AAP38]|nr:hypothetical protein IP70_07865 [alpha proteobacterium AAP38]
MDSQTPNKKPRSNFTQRVISAIVLAPPVLGAVWWGGVPFQVLMMVAVALSAWEYARLAVPGQPKAVSLLLVGVLPLLANSIIYQDDSAGVRVIVMLPVFGALLYAVAKSLRFPNPRLFVFGLPYVAFPFLSMYWLRLESGPYGLALFLFLLLSIWATDIGAYAAGKSIGGPKLAPRISPKKTWAGLIGGMVASATLGGLFGAAQSGDWLPGWLVPPAATDVPHDVSLAAIGAYAAIGAVLAVAGQAGDLFESYMKRRVDVKDSSRLIPGHGGILDRIDGLLFAAPLYALFEMTAGEWVRFW